MPATFTDRKGVAHETPEPLAPLADTHGHLSKRTPEEAAAALMRAFDAGVRLHVIPVDPTDDVADAGAFLAWLDEVRERAGELGTSTYFVAGVHPYGAEKIDASALQRLDALLASPYCKGVGEFGFDFGPWSNVPLEAQKEAFRTHLAIAREHGLPVELHLRDPEKGEPLAHDLALRILSELGVPEAGCDLHCFTSGPDIMEPFANMGCYIAFGGAATFARSKDIRAAAAACPLELILSETDCPYMTPEPLRGSSCEPGMVAFTAARVAEAREEAGASSAQATYAALWDKATRFFGC